jgi:putative membrane protein
MKIHKLLATIAIAAFLAPAAMAQSVGEKTGINSMIGASPTTGDFVKEAATGDMFELQSSQLAQSKGDAETKTFAAKMVADHTKTSSDLKSMVQGGTVKAELPTEMTTSQKSMLDKLKGLTGEDFNKQYMSDQVSAHKDVVSLFQRYAKSGENASLKFWASKTLPVLQGHLTMAQGLSDKYH